MKTLIVLSGGQDSVTCLYWAKQKFGVEGLHAITFDYGQRHHVELQCARNVCEMNGVPQKIVNMDFVASLSQNALTDSSATLTADGGYKNLPSSFVPGRNALFLTLASAYAAPQGCTNIVMGVCQTDYSGYPDCRLEFVKSMEESLSLALDVRLHFHTPLMFLTKAQTFQLSEDLGCLDVVIEESNTCYRGHRQDRFEWGYGCGDCPACELRKKGFEEYQEERARVALKGTHG